MEINNSPKLDFKEGQVVSVNVNYGHVEATVNEDIPWWKVSVPIILPTGEAVVIHKNFVKELES